VISVLLASPDKLAAKSFVDQVLAFAKAQGIDQSKLAKSAGISAESLSRLKNKVRYLGKLGSDENSTKVR